MLASSLRLFSAKTAVKHTFRAQDLTIEKVDVEKLKPSIPGQFAFGKQFTDHMLTVDWDKASGWHAPRIVPHGPIKIETSATALHYGISCYEGISICKNSETNKLQGFRVEEHLNSLRASSEHLDMPTFDNNELTDCLKQLVKLDREWIDWMGEPDQFYTRITHFSTDKTLGVRTPQNTKLIALLNPIQLKTAPLSLKCSTSQAKNWPLGHGSFRISGNMGPLVPAVSDAKNNGFDDVLWLLDGYVKECTVLNVFILQ